MTKTSHDALTAADLAHLADLYFNATEPDVQAFLTAHPFLVLPLIDARPALQQCFGEIPVRLVVFTDPESCYTQLVASVDMDHSISPYEAVARLERFRDDWEIDHLPETQGKLVVMMGYP